jgi:hypothetical protein
MLHRPSLDRGSPGLWPSATPVPSLLDQTLNVSERSEAAFRDGHPSVRMSPRASAAASLLDGLPRGPRRALGGGARSACLKAARARLRHGSFVPRFVSQRPDFGSSEDQGSIWVGAGKGPESPISIGILGLVVLRKARLSTGTSVGETGFEPATARPPAGCATRLRHSPWLYARAGDGNRTRPRSLEGFCATTTLRPQSSRQGYRAAAAVTVRWFGSGGAGSPVSRERSSAAKGPRRRALRVSDAPQAAACSSRSISNQTCVTPS